MKKYSYFLGVNSNVTLSVPKNFFINFNPIYFYGMKFNKPRNTRGYLRLRYGEDWNVPKNNWDHRVEDGTIVHH